MLVKSCAFGKWLYYFLLKEFLKTLVINPCTHIVNKMTASRQNTVLELHVMQTLESRSTHRQVGRKLSPVTGRGVVPPL